MKNLLLVVSLMVVTASPALGETLEELLPKTIDVMQAHLVRDGLSKEEVEVLSEAKISFQKGAVQAKLLDIVRVNPKVTNFVNLRAAKRARWFMKRYRTRLREVWNTKCVPPSIVASILWVESRYGEEKPRFPVLDTLMSLASLRFTPMQGEILPMAIAYAESRPDRFNGLDRVNWKERAGWIGEKWYQQLAAYLRVRQEMNWSWKKARSIKGSWAGAFGYSQFMPTTAEAQLKKWKPNFWSWGDSIRITGDEVFSKGLDHYNNGVSWYTKSVETLAGQIAKTEKNLFPEVARECKATVDDHGHLAASPK